MAKYIIPRGCFSCVVSVRLCWLETVSAYLESRRWGITNNSGCLAVCFQESLPQSRKHVKAFWILNLVIWLCLLWWSITQLEKMMRSCQPHS